MDLSILWVTLENQKGNYIKKETGVVAVESDSVVKDCTENSIRNQALSQIITSFHIYIYICISQH